MNQARVCVFLGRIISTYITVLIYHQIGSMIILIPTYFTILKTLDQEILKIGKLKNLMKSWKVNLMLNLTKKLKKNID